MYKGKRYSIRKANDGRGDWVLVNYTKMQAAMLSAHFDMERIDSTIRTLRYSNTPSKNNLIAQLEEEKRKLREVIDSFYEACSYIHSINHPEE